jgi:hypothetical protein
MRGEPSSWAGLSQDIEKDVNACYSQRFLANTLQRNNAFRSKESARRSRSEIGLVLGDAIMVSCASLSNICRTPSKRLKREIVRSHKSEEYRKALKGTGERLTIVKQILAREEARASLSP